MIEIIYIINKTGVRVTKRFDHPDSADRFWNKLHYSKKCRPVSYITEDS